MKRKPGVGSAARMFLVAVGLALATGGSGQFAAAQDTPPSETPRQQAPIARS